MIFESGIKISKTKQRLKNKRKTYTYDEVIYLLQDYGNSCMAEPFENDFGDRETVLKYIDGKMWSDEVE